MTRPVSSAAHPRRRENGSILWARPCHSSPAPSRSSLHASMRFLRGGGAGHVHDALRWLRPGGHDRRRDLRTSSPWGRGPAGRRNLEAEMAASPTPVVADGDLRSRSPATGRVRTEEIDGRSCQAQATLGAVCFGCGCWRVGEGTQYVFLDFLNEDAVVIIAPVPIRIFGVLRVFVPPRSPSFGSTTSGCPPAESESSRPPGT